MRAGPFVAFAVVLMLGGCGEESKAPTAVDGDPNRGKQAYQAHCVTCHNPDPSKAGPLGPPIKGSSRELLEARILRAAYPPGYKPKRDSAIMQPMPNLAPAIPDLAAFLK